MGSALIVWSFQQQGNSIDWMDVLYISVKIRLLNMLRSFCFIFDVLEHGSFPYPLCVYSIAFLLVVFLVSL